MAKGAGGKPLRLLMVEDSDEDATLILRELKKGGFQIEFERVYSRERLEEALLRGPWDLITADYAMPQFTGVEAFEVVQSKGLDVPFIIVSGTVGEQTAVEAMKAGVHDFVLKDKLQRLVPAIDRELREAKMRTERTKMREQLLVADRMASVGMLSASIAHEINNPLTSIVANLELATRTIGELLATVPPLMSIAEELKDATEGARRLREIALDLKMFSRAPAEQVEPVDLHRIIESALRMARNEVLHRARVVRQFGDVPAVMGNESRLGQVFLNLILNAAQAIEEGHAEENEVRVVTRVDGRGYVIAEVADTGLGMTAEVMEKLFTPLFTTKPVGVGTGLGLAICRRILSDLGAEIGVESQVGKGSVFRVTFPRTTQTSDLAPAVEPEVPAAKRRGKILVVDDEPAIVTVIRRALSLEHDVTGLTDAREALAKINGGERYDVILTDVMMPAMTGPQLFLELKNSAPDQADRVVFLTGGPFATATSHNLDVLPNARIEKPFQLNALRQLINDRVR